ncbi:hypothetical protein F442_04870 [Phytophthora nicotianae P10297]|uniref:Uncharacterized protein n=3 Tax=Phytophthora nicotianae TaxID=4792 RepID=V9FKI1_PHYNI|nr:hypothetical protein F443_04789 [Phytophthora nicotianae P1569]ETM51585.1 hypothetical protein L914_04624 [Phytophthora nicotianae]ETP49672.1 hypothetical protein F442_04870 [Phytophthora nicotianae P10297]
MSNDKDSVISFWIPRCFRRKKTPPTVEMIGNIFEQRIMQRLKKHKRSSRLKHSRPRPISCEFKTLDVPDQPLLKPKQEQCQMLSWDSFADSPPSSVGAEAGGIIGTTHMKNPCDVLTSSRYTALLVRQETFQEAAFRLHQLAHLDMNNSTSSFEYQIPRQSGRQWSTATTRGSVG